MANKGKILIISGPSGAGKGSVVQELVSNYNNYVMVDTVTSRRPRPEEVGNSGYVFVSNKEFENAIKDDKFFEYDNLLGTYYGTLKDSVYEKVNQGINVVLEAPMECAVQMKQQSQETILVYIIAPNAWNLAKCLAVREQDEERTRARLKVYEREMYGALKADILLVNENTNKTVHELVNSMDNPEYRKSLYEENVELVIKLKKGLKRYTSLESLYVFISYSTKNQEEADGLRCFLRENGIDTWMAPYDISAGSKYAESINQAIKNCSCCVLILSEAAQKSVWVAKEIERVINYRKILIPLSLENVVLNDEFELYISSNHILSVGSLDSDSTKFQGVLNTIKKSFEIVQKDYSGAL